MMKKVVCHFQCVKNVISLPYLKNYIRNYAKHVASPNIVNLDESTLTGRLMIYLKAQKTEFQKKTDSIINSKEAIQLLKRGSLSVGPTSPEELMGIINSLKYQYFMKEQRELIRLVDNECCHCLKNMKSSEILDMLDALMGFTPNRVPQLKFYGAAINKLFGTIEEMRGKQFMRFIFYVGLMKKCEKSQKILRQSMRLLNDDDVKNWTSEDICVIANSMFKTSTKISKQFILHRMKNYLSDNLMLIRDPALFITLLKCFRQNRYYNEDLMASITCALFFNKSFELYSFQTYCHLLAFYSDNLYYDETLLDFISKKCIEELMNYNARKTGHDKIRLKQIVRLLWGFSNLNSSHINKEHIKTAIIPRLLDFIESPEYSLDYMIDVLLYLWMLNYRSPELFPHLIEKRDILSKIPDKTNAKQKFNLLLNLLYYEDRPLFKTLGLYPQGSTNFVPSQHLKDRPCLRNVLDSLKTLGPKINMRFEVGYQIPHTNILGITGYTKNIYKSVNIEILDDFTTLKNTEDRPTGLMQVKLRILDGAEEALIVVNKSKVENLTPVEMEQYLQEELELVC